MHAKASKIEDVRRRPQKLVDDFLTLVFGAPSRDLKHEQIPLWSSSEKKPGFPLLEKRFNKKAFRAQKPQANYFGCSTLKLTEDGDLRNRQSQFAGFYVLVLDDVGTGVGSKVRPEQIPAALRERTSYRIETSPDNEQWGFVLEEPIRNLEHAKAFQNRIVQKSGADGGGCMPNKLVRLPMGFNLKEKHQDADGAPFACRLLELNEKNLWTPEEMLAAVDAGQTWEQLKSGAHVDRRAGTTAYRREPVYHASLDGVVDSVLEWLNTQGHILNDAGEWIDIVCPWAGEHSDAEANSAGYAPIGRGDRPTERGFKCFHNACTDHRTEQFLAHVVKEGGPRTSKRGVKIETLIARYAFSAEDNAAIDMKSGDFNLIKQQGFKNQLSGDIWLPNADGKARVAVNEYKLFMSDPNRMRLAGRRSVVGGPLVIPDASGGDPYLNTWRLPEWGDGPFDQALVNPFLEFMHYLLLRADDAEWFLDHLAAKAQNPKYRGPAVIQSTPTEGTGRGSFEKILKLMWGRKNLVRLTLSELSAGVTGKIFNPWITASWFVIPEAKEANMSAKEMYTRYESLKPLWETGDSYLILKEKNLHEQSVDCFGSTIICSQHGDVMPASTESTRIRRMQNAIKPWSVEQFDALHCCVS